MMENNTAIIVPYFEGSEYLNKLLATIELDEGKKYTVFIIDNDKEGCPIEEFGHLNINVIKTNYAIGFARAVNLGVYRALYLGFEYFIVINQDSYFEKGALFGLFEAIKKFDDLIVTPLIRKYDSEDLDPSNWNYIQQSFHGSKSSAMKNNKRFYQHDDVMPATCWVFSKNLVEKNNLFDPVFYHYEEDLDFCYRNNMQFIIDTHSFIYHQTNPNIRSKEYLKRKSIVMNKSRIIMGIRYCKIMSILHQIKDIVRIIIIEKDISLLKDLVFYLLKILFIIPEILCTSNEKVKKRIFIKLSKDWKYDSKWIHELSKL